MKPPFSMKQQKKNLTLTKHQIISENFIPIRGDMSSNSVSVLETEKLGGNSPLLLKKKKKKGGGGGGAFSKEGGTCL